jgi:hypothetical protein
VNQHERKKAARGILAACERLREACVRLPFDQERRAAAAREAHALLHRTYDLWCRVPADELLSEARVRTVELSRLAQEAAFPPGFWEDIARLKAGERSGLETALRFLEADPWFLGSGYVKEDLLRWVLRCEWSPADAARLRQVVLNALDGPTRRETRQFCNLAAKLDSPELRRELEARLESGSISARRHARWALEAIGVLRSKKPTVGRPMNYRQTRPGEGCDRCS